MLNHLLGHEGEDLDYGRDFYTRSIRWEVGAILQFSPDRPEAHLTLPGSAVDLIPVDQQYKFVQDLPDVFFRWGRVDLAADDFTREIFDLDRIHVAGDAYNFTGPRTYKHVIEKQKGKLTGRTCYFGTRQSNAYTRFYDKALETKGKINCIRFEVEYKHEHAAAIGEALSSSPTLQSFTDKIGRHLTRALTFIDRTPDAHNHVSRMQRLDWWVRVIDLLGTAEIVINRSTPPLQKTLLHLKHQYRKILGLAALVVEETGHDFGEIVLTWIRQGAAIMKGKRPGARALGVDVAALLGLPEHYTCKS